MTPSSNTNVASSIASSGVNNCRASRTVANFEPRKNASALAQMLWHRVRLQDEFTSWLQFTQSLFQSKNEPGVSLRGWRRKAPFWILYGTSLAVVGAVAMWESRSDFQGRCETRRVLHPPSFPPPFRRLPQLLEEFDFGLLHALGGFGIAESRSDALENSDGESWA